MNLETRIKNCKFFVKKLLVGTLLAGSLVIGCAEDNPPRHVIVDEPVEIDTSHVGMIMGQVLSSQIENNQVIYRSLEGARVYIQDTDFKTETVSNGIYSIDNIPTGSYNVVAQKGWGGPEDTKPITVIKQETVTVPNLKIIADPILKGKIYETGTPFANEEVDIHSVSRGYPSGELSLDSPKLYSTTTSSDGSYAFKRNKEGRGEMTRFCLKNSEAVIVFWDTDKEFSKFIPFRYDIVEKDAYVSEYK